MPTGTSSSAFEGGRLRHGRIPDADNPWAITGELMDAVLPGSYLAVSHGGRDIKDQDLAAAGSRYNEHSAVHLGLRARQSSPGSSTALSSSAPA
jgi:hypothetical protein